MTASGVQKSRILQQHTGNAASERAGDAAQAGLATRPAFNDAQFQGARDAGRFRMIPVQRDEFMFAFTVDPQPVFRQGLAFGHLANAPGALMFSSKS